MKTQSSQLWWCMYLIPVLRDLCEFHDIVRHCLKIKQKQNNKTSIKQKVGEEKKGWRLAINKKKQQKKVR